MTCKDGVIIVMGPCVLFAANSLVCYRVSICNGVTVICVDNLEIQMSLCLCLHQYILPSHYR